MKEKIKQIISKNAQLVFAEGILEEITNDINSYIKANKKTLKFEGLYSKLTYWFSPLVACVITNIILGEIK